MPESRPFERGEGVHRPESGAEGGPGADEQIARELSADRERIAYDLADSLVHRIFEISLQLHGALTQISEPAAIERIREALTGLDEAIKELRAAMFDVEPGDQ